MGPMKPQTTLMASDSVSMPKSRIISKKHIVNLLIATFVCLGIDQNNS